MFLSHGAVWITGLVGLGLTGRRWMRLLNGLEQLATHDVLTGLCNRRELTSKLEHEVVRAERYGHPLALIMLDIDHFKRVNDGHGQAGRPQPRLRGGLMTQQFASRFSSGSGRLMP